MKKIGKRFVTRNRVRLRSSVGVSARIYNRLGTVGYSPYSIGLCAVYWDGRKTHDILKTEILERVKP